MARTIEILGQEFQLFRLEGHGTQVFVREDCWKCAGGRILPHYLHVHDGVCFACNGSGGQYLTPEQMTKRIKGRQYRAAAKARKQDAKARKLAADLAAFTEAQPELAFMTTDVVFDEDVDLHPILRDMGQRLQRWGSLSEKQVAFANRLVLEAQTGQSRKAQREAQWAAEREMAAPAPAGREVVEGLVIKAVENTNYHNGHEVWTVRITVKTDAGWIANGNAPGDLLRAAWAAGDHEIGDVTPEENIKGRRVRFTATVEPKASDPTFAFFKRPIKGELIQEEVVNLD